jgi:ABC-type multidrug transport system fused ATPase/permease subunit
MHKLNNGSININGSTGYTSQCAWIQNATIRENILFGNKYNEEYYFKIIEACCLVTDLEMMPNGDLTQIGEKGMNLSGGQKQRISLARLCYSNNVDIYLFDDTLSAVDAHVGKKIFDNLIGPNGLLNTKTRIFATNSLNFLSQVDQIILLKNGHISEQGTYDQIKKSIKVEFFQTNNQIELADNLKSFNQQEQQQEQIDKNKPKSNRVQTSTLKFYFKASSYLLTCLTVFFFSIVNISSIGSNLWLTDWSNNNNSSHTKVFRLVVYSGLGFIQCILTLISDYFFLLMILKSAQKIHSKLIGSILKSEWNFFQATPSGHIINRFSKDIDTIEKSLPEAFKSVVVCFFHVFFSITVIIGTTPLFCIAFIPIILVYFLIQQYFIPTSRRLKHLESESKSPIFAHFTETQNGLTTIRSFQAQERFIQTMENKIDENLVYYFPSNISNRWLAIRLELIGCLITSSAALFAVLSRDSISPGLAGLSITYSLNCAPTLNHLVKMFADFETNIISVERIDEYLNNKQHEKPWHIAKTKPSNEWPQNGNILIENYSVKYKDNLTNVLENLNLKIKSGEKIGIVGRTGAGKSSLTLGLFRLLENSTGLIRIDGIDIKTIGLHDLRHKLTIIPQDPVLFSGTLLMNLDPLSEKINDKTQIWNALEQVNLKEFVLNLDKQLEFECSEGGENLSVGQRQLICLARALLRQTKILILDEATASVDHNTDKLIQTTIRNHFKDCTVLAIAHRLHTIVDYSRFFFNFYLLFNFNFFNFK